MADNSSSPRRGWLYLAWAAGLYPDVYFSRSTDGGATWSSPRIIHSDTTNDQFWPWLSVDPLSGDIAVMFSDSRNDPENILIDQYVAYSSDGGDTWLDRRSTDFMSDFRKNPFTQGIFAGDYSGNAFYDGRIYPSFLDTRTDANNLDNDVYVALMNVRQPFPVDSLTVTPDPNSLDFLAVKWVKPAELRSLFGIPLTNPTVVVRRDSAVIIATSVQLEGFIDQGLEHGRLYTYDVAVAAGGDTSIWRTASARAGGALEPAAPAIVSHRWRGDSVELDIRTPAVRADGSVPLANLGGLRLLRDSVVVRELALAAMDTGQVLTLVDVPGERGYYRYAVTAIDALQNESAASNQIVSYAGSLEPYVLNFDGPIPRLLMTGTWGRTQSLSVSPPSSLTDSPQRDYAPSRRTTVDVFPFRAIASRIVSFAHIAVVDPSDTAVVEMRLNSDTVWRRVAAYNWEADARWSDSAASPADWRTETLDLAAFGLGSGDTAWLRFRLRTGIARNADGWYVDDIAVGIPSGIPSELAGGRLFSRARPNPFRDVALIELSLDKPGAVSARLLDPLGREVLRRDLGDLDEGHHSWTIDGRSLPAGLYTYEISGADGRATGAILRIP